MRGSRSNGRLGGGKKRRLKGSAMEMSGCCNNELSAALSSVLLKRA